MHNLLRKYLSWMGFRTVSYFHCGPKTIVFYKKKKEKEKKKWGFIGKWKTLFRENHSN